MRSWSCSGPLRSPAIGHRGAQAGDQATHLIHDLGAHALPVLGRIRITLHRESLSYAYADVLLRWPPALSEALRPDVRGAPYGRRDHRSPRGEGQPGQPRLGRHRIQVWVVGDRALREDDDDLALAQSFDRLVKCHGSL